MNKEEKIEENKQKYEGKIFKNKQGCEFKIIEYRKSSEILIEFQDKYKQKKITSISEIKSGVIRNKYHPTICGVGFVGDFNPNVATRNRETGKFEILKEYDCWHAMLRRCYDKKTQNRNKNKAYETCTVSEEWHNFTNFYNWIIQEPNYKKWKKGAGWCLDKDIIKKGNKEYSPETCCLVPNEINVIFTKRQNDRGQFVIGVRFHKKNKNYEANISRNGKIKCLGTFKTEAEAYAAYKEAKESYIKKIAEKEYEKGNISKKCYQAMKEYEVDIND